MDKVLEELWKVLFNRPFLIPRNWRIFLVTENSFLYVNDGASEYAPHYSIDHDWKNVPERGDLLDRFTKIEFLITELVRAQILPLSLENDQKLLDIIRNQSARTKIEYLRKWQVIDQEIGKTLISLFEVRNNLAHNFNKANAKYAGDYLSVSTSWEKFRQDLNSVWSELVSRYKKEEEKIDFSLLKKQFKERR